MKLHRDSFKNLFIDHHSNLKLGAYQIKNNSHHVDEVMDLFLCKSCIICFSTHIEAFQFLLNFCRIDSLVLEQEKYLKVEKFLELVIRIF